MADETTTFEAAGYTAQGAASNRVTLPAPLFDGTVNMPVMHQAVKAFLANQRQGNAKTKIRKFVTGGNQKPWKQKGTGRARQGSIRAPNWVGGGTVFGPIPRSYAQYVPKQVRALARKSALNARARENAVFVIDALDFDAPKTKQLQALIASLGLAEQKVLLLTDGLNREVFLSGRNMPLVHVMPYSDVSTYHLLWSDTVVIERGALGLEETAPARRARTSAAGAEAETSTAAPARGARKAAGSKRAVKKAEKREAKAGSRGAGSAKRAAASAATRGGAKRGGAKKSAAKRSGATTSKKKGT